MALELWDYWYVRFTGEAVFGVHGGDEVGEVLEPLPAHRFFSVCQYLLGSVSVC